MNQELLRILDQKGLSPKLAKKIWKEIQQKGDLGLSLIHPAYLMASLGYKVTKFHLEWFKLIEDNKNLVILAPRGHGKSVLVACYVIYRIMKNPNIRILVVSNTGTQSSSFMHLVKSHFESPEFQRMYGNYVTDRKWTTTEIIVKGRTKVLREPTLSVSSVGGAVISRHIDLLIADDCVDEENARTLGQRSILETWFFKTLTPTLEPDAKSIIIGTRWHYDDLYGYLINQGWKHIIMGTPLNPKFDEKGILCDGEPIWEWRFPMKELIARYIKMGSIFYNSQYFNDPSGMKGQFFELDWFNWYTEEQLPKELKHYIGVDPAIASGEENAYFALIVIAISEVGDIYVREVYQARIPIQTQINKVRDFTSFYNPFIIGIETNAYQKVLAQLLEAYVLPIQEIDTVTDKVTRAIQIQPYVQNRKVYVKREHKETLVKQMIQFPNVEKKDLVDAFGFAIQCSRGGTYVIKDYEDTKTRESVGVSFFDIGEVARLPKRIGGEDG